MGWGLIINNVYLNRVTKTELPAVLDATADELKTIREQLLMLAAATPHAVADNQDWVDYVHTKVSEALQAFEEAVIKRHLAQCASDNPEDVTEG